MQLIHHQNLMIKNYLKKSSRVTIHLFPNTALLLRIIIRQLVTIFFMVMQETILSTDKGDDFIDGGDGFDTVIIGGLKQLYLKL